MQETLIIYTVSVTTKGPKVKNSYIYLVLLYASMLNLLTYASLFVLKVDVPKQTLYPTLKQGSTFASLEFFW